MIDVHSHYIPYVDDGSKSIDDSIKLLMEAASFGISDIICTPHYRKHMFETTNEEIERNFYLLKDEANKKNIGINLYLGREIYCRHISDINEFIKNNRLVSMNKTKYVLLEFSYVHDIDITEIVYLTKLAGFIPIIAHIERYEYADIDLASEIKNMGALIQINASSIVGREGSKVRRRALKMIENGFANFVASDIHVNRHNDMKKAYQLIKRKFKEEVANNLFNENGKILIGENI